MRNLSAKERALAQLLGGGVNSFDNSADAPVVSPQNPALMKSKGNPSFEAQFDVNFLIFYTTEVAGVYTLKTPAQVLAAGLNAKFPAFLFGNSDYSGGFAKLRQQYPVLNGWVMGTPFVYGTQTPHDSFGPTDNTINSQFVTGDLIIPFTVIAAGPVNWSAFVVVRCTQVAYGTLLGALSSDKFIMNMIRYVMADTTAVGLAQYSNQIGVFKQTLFGKFDSDYASPNSFKMPENQQTGIIDIPLVKGIDKQIALATYINYDAPNVLWSIFVDSVNKLDYAPQ